jgi:hypothetical protein
LFDDLRAKLAELAKTNSTAKSISKDIEQRAEEQKVFETPLLDQLKSNKLITEMDASYLEQIRVHRNKAAHPSGMHASPEEARYVYFETIDKFLSKQLLRTTHAVDSLMERLTNSNFMPTETISEVKDITSNELQGLHTSALPYLFSLLVPARTSEDKTLSRNAAMFFQGLAAQETEEITKLLQSQLIKSKVDDPAYGGIIFTSISVNPNLLIGLDKTTMLRTRALLEKQVDKTKSTLAVTKLIHPVYNLVKILQKLGDSYVQLNLKTFRDKVIAEYAYTATLLSKISGLENASTQLFAVWVKRAGSSDFNEANSFAAAIPDLDHFLPTLISMEQAFQLVVEICRASEIGAFTAQDLQQGKFLATPQLRLLAGRYAAESPGAADKIVVAKLTKLNYSALLGLLGREEQMI